MMAHESHYAEFYAAGHPAMQSFEPNHDFFGPQGGMEMLGHTSKHPSSNLGRGFITPGFLEASNKNFVVSTEVVASTSPWQVDESSLRSLFPCQETEQPGGRLSLSLFNPKPPDAIGVPQSFHQSDSRDVLLSRAESSHRQQVFLQEGRVFNSQQPFQLKNSRYLIPAKELLNEFCSLGGEIGPKKKSQKASEWEEGGPSSSSSLWNQPLNSMDLLELQRRKAKLLSMLEEVSNSLLIFLLILLPSCRSNKQLKSLFFLKKNPISGNPNRLVWKLESGVQLCRTAELPLRGSEPGVGTDYL